MAGNNASMVSFAPLVEPGKVSIRVFFLIPATYVEVFNGWLKKTKPEAVFINCYYSYCSSSFKL